jgi:hypothetical protein
MTSVTAVNLSTGEERLYTCSPREAVVAAYAQERKDNNTWQYAERYDHLVQQGRWHVFCGDWGVRLPPAPEPQVTSTAAAKKIIKDFLAERPVSYSRLTAKTVNLQDLARVGCIFVTIHGWTPGPVAEDIRHLAKRHGFRVEFDVRS